MPCPLKRLFAYFSWLHTSKEKGFFDENRLTLSYVDMFLLHVATMIPCYWKALMPTHSSNCYVIKKLLCYVSYLRWPIAAIPYIILADASILRNQVIPAQYLRNSINSASLWSSGRCQFYFHFRANRAETKRVTSCVWSRRLQYC